jgi:hypothetical protein
MTDSLVQTVFLPGLLADNPCYDLPNVHSSDLPNCKASRDRTRPGLCSVMDRIPHHTPPLIYPADGGGQGQDLSSPI